MAIKVGINGFGRIGILTVRRMLFEHPSLELVGINDLSSEADLKNSFQNDLVYGFCEKNLDGVRFFQEKEPSFLPWTDLSCDIVLECSGFFTHIDQAKKHLQAGARKVIISAPSDSQEIPTYLLGVNQEKYRFNQDHIISMGSCTTNAVAPMAKILDKNFGVKNGFVNTVHSYTNSQNKIFPYWRKDSAGKLSIIPSTTGATKTIEKCLPQLKEKLNGLSLRVPTETVSIVEFVFLAKKKTTAEAVNRALEKASKTDELQGILKFETRKVVSSDLKGSSYSSIIDASLTQVFGKLIKVFAWYDNEWGYACRLAEMAEFVGLKL